MTFPSEFIWGASTAAHQIEGNNTDSDFWVIENTPGSFLPERSGDACDSLHRWGEDLDLLAATGLGAYRFSVEWSRVEPVQGHVSKAMLAHYRRIIDGCHERGLVPMVTLHHFTSPAWFATRGGWPAPDAVESFLRYVAAVIPILGDVRWICTINEPNMLAMMANMMREKRRAETWPGRCLRRTPRSPPCSSKPITLRVRCSGANLMPLSAGRSPTRTSRLRQVRKT